MTGLNIKDINFFFPGLFVGALEPVRLQRFEWWGRALRPCLALSFCSRVCSWWGLSVLLAFLSRPPLPVRAPLVHHRPLTPTASPEQASTRPTAT